MPASTGSQQPGTATDTALASFVLLLSFLDRSVDPDQLRHTVGKGSQALTVDDLVRLAKKLDVRARKVSARAEQLTRLPLPAIAVLSDGEHLLVLQATTQKVLVFRTGEERPRTLER